MVLLLLCIPRCRRCLTPRSSDHTTANILLLLFPHPLSYHRTAAVADAGIEKESANADWELGDAVHCFLNIYL
jgi:hypothetical protein